jgi:hypothetical protein
MMEITPLAKEIQRYLIRNYIRTGNVYTDLAKEIQRE